VADRALGRQQHPRPLEQPLLDPQAQQVLRDRLDRYRELRAPDGSQPLTTTGLDDVEFIQDYWTD